MVELTIDNRSVQMEPGKTVLEACQKLNIPIPTLCYHKALSPYGTCRLCVVEITKEGKKSIHASCTYPVEPGIDVTTNTPELLNIRRTMIELLMARAPGSEKVREIASSLGVHETRFIKLNKDCIPAGSAYVCVANAWDVMSWVLPNAVITGG